MLRILRPSFLLRLRPLSATHFLRLPIAATGGASFSMRPMTSSVNDPPSNSSNQPTKKNVDDGCDFKHWLVFIQLSNRARTRDQIIDSYIKTLANVVGSEEEAKKSIYSVSTKYYFAFGCIVSQELSCKINTLPNVRWVVADSYLDVEHKDYPGEPFVDGKAVPYDPKYHKWLRRNEFDNKYVWNNSWPLNSNPSWNRGYQGGGNGGYQGGGSGGYQGGGHGYQGGGPAYGDNFQSYQGDGDGGRAGHVPGQAGGPSKTRGPHYQGSPNYQADGPAYRGRDLPGRD